MRVLRSEGGNALITAILVVAMMAGLGTAMVSIIDTQTTQTRVQRSSDTTFNLAEATLNAEAFLLGRNWPQSTANMPTPAGPASPCSGQSITGTLDDPPASATPSLRDQIQSVLAQTYAGSTTTTGAQWWLTACQEGGRNAWDSSLLNGLAYDPTVASSPAPQPRRMWVRAEAKIDGRRRAVAALVQAGQQAVFPNLGLVTGIMGDDLGNVLNGLTSGPLLGPITNLLINSDPIVVGNVGLRCSLLDATDLLGCLSGLLKATSALGPIGALLQANNYVDYNSDSTISADQLSLLRQQAQATGTYYPSASNGTGAVANGASCLPANSAGKIIFIDKIGNGTGSCIINSATNPSAKALIVGSGGVRVCSNSTCAASGTPGTYTGVIYTLHRADPTLEDVRIEMGAKVVGGVYIDDNSALASSSIHGSFKVVPPAVSIDVLQNNILCYVPLLGNILCGTLNAVINLLGLNTVLANILPQINPNLPAVTYNDTVVKSVTTFGDSSIVPGTFRQVTPMF
jgi:Tfp pilus assembly protein PilX